MGEEKVKSAIENISCGLFAVTSFDGKRHNGLIVNTVFQVTNSPNRIAVAINKQSYSHNVIKESGIMNVNILSVKAKFSVFERFGFRSGRDTDKFEGYPHEKSRNGLCVLTEHINSFISLKAVQYIDLDTHGLFICTVTEEKTVSQDDSMTYAYYHKNVKPKPESSGKKAWVCKICGYVHEGDLPDGFVCPLCLHGAEDFEPLL